MTDHLLDSLGVDSEQQRLEIDLISMRLSMPRERYNTLLEEIAGKHGALYTKGGDTSWSVLIPCRGGEIEEGFRAALRELASKKEA